MMDVSVVIVNYNVKELVLQSLETLFRYNKACSLEVFVVDNHSSDGSAEAIRNRFPEVHLIENTFNAGFPGANNQAFALSRGRYVFMLNPDTEFSDDALVKLVHYLDAHPEVGLAGPRLLNSDGSYQASVWRYPSLKGIFLEMLYLKSLLGFKNYADQDKTKPFEAESFSGAAILFRKEVMENIGVLDEQLFWIEDVDYCYRAKHAGYTLMYYPYAAIKHHIGQSAKKNYNITVCNQIVNKIKFFKKYHPGLPWLTVVILSFGEVMAKLLVFTLLSPFNSIYARKARAYVYTLPRVFNPPQGMK
ncbi:MAG TPA: glycosyltransferase family 2 protein [Bacteroidia bacterium]|jgi:GT2 family glycosyltransferase|nr:glycosyltransferase family 2 protein [Bacteroidia bacterium]